MAQASSAQREPSMEEILASIRRIIEDSDQGHETSGKPSHLHLQDNADSDDGEADGAAGEPPAETEAAPPLRLAEVQKRLREEQAPAAAVGADAVPEIGESAVEAAAQTSPADWPVNDWRDGGDWQDSGMEAAAAAPAEMEHELTGPPDAAERRHAIISEMAGRKVAAAFGELNEAFEASRRQSLGDMAEEMLRPMLQDWLDNNLPTLVERLVREEIERVARGGAH